MMDFSQTSSADLHQPDVYNETQYKIEKQDAYEKAQKANEAETYYEANKLTGQIARIYSQTYHLLSFLTGAFLCVYLAILLSSLDGESRILDYVLFSLSLIGLIGLLAVNEIFKYKSHTHTFKALSLKRKVSIRSILLAGGTGLLSILVSAGGIFYLTILLSDKSDQINDSSDLLRASTQGTYQADSLAWENQYHTRKTKLEAAIAEYSILPKSPHIKRVAWTCGHKWCEADWALTPKAQEMLALDKQELSKLENTHLEELKSLKEGKTLSLDQIGTSQQGQLALNEVNTFQYAILAFSIVVILELVCAIMHFYYRIFLAKVEKEGIEFKALENSREVKHMHLTTLKLQAAARQLQLYQQAMGNHLEQGNPFLQPGAIAGQNKPDPEAIPAEDSEGEPIGFKRNNQGKENPPNSQGKPLHTRSEKTRYYFVGNQPFDHKDNTGKTYNKSATRIRNEKQIKRAWVNLEKKLNRPPQIKEVAQKVGINRNTVARYLKDLELIKIEERQE